jgi:hypothetical protein
MAKTYFTDGSFLTPAYLNTQFGTDANTGHLHSGANTDGSLPKVNLQSCVQGPMNLIGQYSPRGDASAYTIYADTQFVSDSVVPHTTNGGSIGALGNVWNSVLANQILATDMVDSTHVSNSLTVNGQFNPPYALINVNTYPSDLGTPQSTLTEYNIVGLFVTVYIPTIVGEVSHSPTGQFRLILGTAPAPFGTTLLGTLGAEMYSCLVWAGASDTAITSLMPGAFSVASQTTTTTTLQFYNAYNYNTTAAIRTNGFGSVGQNAGEPGFVWTFKL